MDIRRIRVALGERALIHLDERPVRWLTPGRHWLVSLRPLTRFTVLILRADALVAKLAPEQVAMAPAEDLAIVRLAPHERAIVRMRGVAVRWLGPGEHQVLMLERSVQRGRDGAARAVEVEVLDTSAVESEPLNSDVKAIVPSADHAEVTVPHGAVALRFVDGVLDATLGPGRHAAAAAAAGHPRCRCVGPASSRTSMYAPARALLAPSGWPTGARGSVATHRTCWPTARAADGSDARRAPHRHHGRAAGSGGRRS